MYNTKFCKIAHLNKENAILCEWKQFCKGDDYRDPLRYAQEEINKHNITIWITDTTNGFEKWRFNGRGVVSNDYLKLYTQHDSNK